MSPAQCCASSSSVATSSCRNRKNVFTMYGKITEELSTNEQSPSTSNTALPQPAFVRSFYRRPLPIDTCTALSSIKGRSYFASAMQHGGLESYFPLMEQHLTQSEPAFCGISTLVIALNAMAIDPKQTWKGPWRWYEEKMLNCCVDLEQVKLKGITLKTFKCLAICQGLNANIDYADNTETPFPEESFESRFRRAVIEACVQKNRCCTLDDTSGLDCETCAQVLQKVLIVSYDRRVLRQTGSGHFSPIAAYDPESDSVLIMDTARFKYGAHWVPLSLLAKAMLPTDPDTGHSRGFVSLVNPTASSSKSDLPVAILLRSDMKDYVIRRDFKRFLNDLTTNNSQKDVKFDDIARYWTKNGTDPHFVWNNVRPQSFHSSNSSELQDAVHELRTLIDDLLIKTEGVQSFRKFCPGILESLSNTNEDVRVEEALFIIYLACLQKSQRHEIVYRVCDNGRVTDCTSRRRQHQLLAEAELVRYAIDVSDEIEDLQLGATP